LHSVQIAIEVWGGPVFSRQNNWNTQTSISSVKLAFV
jgi:hypothetical protein